MRYLSVCSGVEAASVAWHDLGWTPVGFSEIEPFPSAVLAHRFPAVKNYGDMTKYKEWDIEPGTVDVLVGGTPCQSFSVAGLRKGLDDPRGNLMLVYLGLAEHLRVPWLVWENVPGVLSSNGGRDFGTFLGALGELGYQWSFRVLDAQHFGVPQRRRRVFVVGHLGEGADPAEVLFESESLRGDTAKGGKKGQGAPRGARPSPASGGRVGVDIVGTLCSDTHPGAYSGQDAYTGRLVPQFFDEQASGSQYGTGSVASTCSTRDYKDATDLVVQPATGSHWDDPALPHPSLAQVGHGVTGGIGMSNQAIFSQRGAGLVPQPVCATGHRTHALTVSDSATEDGTGRGTPIVPVIAFHPTQDPISSVEVTHALGTGSKGGCATAAVAMINMQGSKGNAVAQADGPSYTLNAMHGHDVHAVGVPIYEVTGTLSSRATAAGGLGTDFEVAGGLQAVDVYNGRIDGPVTAIITSAQARQNGSGAQILGPTMAVRRLLPVECERLQGFPDDWTNIPWRGKPAPDGPRYKAMGNSMAVPVMRWIGQRLDRVAKGDL
jgi:DNA (cytosine-5)-methyltransferase 1